MWAWNVTRNHSTGPSLISSMICSSGSTRYSELQCKTFCA